MQPLHTCRLTLRAFSAQDGAALLDYLHQPTASCFFSLAVADLDAAANEARKRAEGESYRAVCLRETGALIGDLFAEAEGDTFSIGWHLNPRYAGQGYAFEAAAALVRELFEQRQARRLYAYVEDTNLASQRLCEKLGMRREGVFMEYVTFSNDEHGQPIYENTQQYALLRHEWLAQQR
ncbi:GNAT family N-acetyltransferase [Pseudomonas cremoricolorata]|uniref:GCN5 family acetyltransferase n=1 Tax=Pseudomonas cremoricolorata TaxID=157783 RepID=A0A089YGX2_9PSED|nr:GNAT family protein [Pseudomonas cremoricolorata]AIR90963.1 GCN5 family acetyltransferase [Pseudomonas cremoricolorata]